MDDKNEDNEKFESFNTINDENETRILLENEYDSLDSIDEQIFNNKNLVTLKKNYETKNLDIKKKYITNNLNNTNNDINNTNTKEKKNWEFNFEKINEYLDSDLINENRILEILIEMEKKIDEYTNKNCN